MSCPATPSYSMGTMSLSSVSEPYEEEDEEESELARVSRAFSDLISAFGGLGVKTVEGIILAVGRASNDAVLHRVYKRSERQRLRSIDRSREREKEAAMTSKGADRMELLEQELLRLQNQIAELNKTAPSREPSIASHYPSIPPSPAAARRRLSCPVSLADLERHRQEFSIPRTPGMHTPIPTPMNHRERPTPVAEDHTPLKAPVNVHTNPLAAEGNVEAKLKQEAAPSANPMGSMLQELLRKTKAHSPIRGDSDDSEVPMPAPTQATPQAPAAWAAIGSKGGKGGKGGKGSKGAKGAGKGSAAKKVFVKKAPMQPSTNKIEAAGRGAGKQSPSVSIASMSDLTGDVLLAQRSMLKKAKKKPEKTRMEKNITPIALKRRATAVVAQPEKENSSPAQDIMAALQMKFKMRNRRESADRRDSLASDWSGDEA